MVEIDQGEILLIEDDDPIRDTLKELLELEGYRVQAVPNGKEGLSQLKNMPRPCLVLLDLFMPVMSGLEFLHSLKKDYQEVAPSFPIVILSAAPPEGEIAQVAKTLSQGFISKPVDLDSLLCTVENYCGCDRKSALPSPI